MAHELVPTATIIAVLVNPSNPNTETELRELQAAARTLGLQLHALYASNERDFDTVFATLLQLRVGALVIGADAFFVGRSEQLAALALRHAVPAIFGFREFAAAGGLMSYGANLKAGSASSAKSAPAAASDEHYRLLLSERFYALQETATGSFMDIGACK